MIDRSQADWYKDAVIYQLHIKAFFDANNDGIGDFAGLMQKLDYVQELGVNTVWLLPFYPSPLRDDGYDIADYRNVNPSFGTLRDVRTFVKAAHERGLRVITELVINHTSDQHPWFQRARLAKRGSAHRNYYVWSDTDQRYLGHPHHLHRHRAVELDVGSGRAAVFLASLLLPPARPQLRQPAAYCARSCASCTSGWRWASTACASTRSPIWSSARARSTRTCPRPTPS